MRKTVARLRLWQYTRLGGRTIILDANVLIYAYWSCYNTRRWMDYYGKMVQKMLSHGCRLAVDSNVISEAINVVIRKEWTRLMDKHPELGYTEFKNFRDSLEGQAALTKIHEVIENDIFPQIEVVERPYSKSDILKLLVVNRLDFVDKLLVLLCEDSDYVLLTNDGDFADSEIDILSNNDSFFPASNSPPPVQP